ncbi:hypothetical protein C8T65DRAFT_672391 [Cerioporus squamosus]|nr:hypothetical protein C8T65DRAFT_672391 [Cerioporus squamosus]
MPPTPAGPLCVSPVDTVFSPVPSLSSPGVPDTPDSLGCQSPVTPNLPTIPIPVQAVMLVPSSDFQSPTHFPAVLLGLDSCRTLPNVAPGVPVYMLYGMPYTAPATSTVPPQTTPTVTQRSIVSLAPSSSRSRTLGHTKSHTTTPSKSAGQTSKPFECLICGVVIRNRISNFRQHMREQHDPTFQRAKCPHCPCSYKRLSDLHNHIINKH